MSQNVYCFLPGAAEGDAKMRNTLGGKGANLAEMTSLGLPVPPGFTISTGMCEEFYKNSESLPESLKKEIQTALSKVEKVMNKKFGNIENPLLVSVRSGARVSMPGMMDTVLNLGLNEKSLMGLAKKSDNERFAWDSYRRFVQMYSNVVMGMNTSFLDIILEDLKDEKSYTKDTDLTVEDLKWLVKKFKNEIITSTGKNFPEDPVEQLWGAISAVFKSWNTPRAVTYRNLNQIDHHWGTAVNVQSMVFGNMGDDCATGVAFTRDPSTGEKRFYGEYLINAQGEDVVAGIRTPQSLVKNGEGDSLEETMPKAYGELVEVYQNLEKHYRDMQDIEFTIEQNKLWMLQTRGGKRTAQAALRIACDMIDEKLITEQEALLRLDPHSLDQLLHSRLDPNAEKTLLAKGLPASPGGARGQVVFHSEDAVKYLQKGIETILVRVETSPDDIEGMDAAKGVLTTRGGMTSHAAVVARGMGKCCVAGCAEAHINAETKELRIKGFVIKEGDMITLDGGSGEIFQGEVSTIDPELDDYFSRVMTLSDKYRRLGVRTNADTPKDAEKAVEFGAEGIGLCRTEHMFFDPKRIDVMRKMIMSETTEQRISNLNELLPMQRSDFKGLFEAMGERPVTIRLLDPPLHEFLPHTEAELSELSKRIGEDVSELKQKVKALNEFNPMLGHRGCRLAITFPEIYEMQAKAIALAMVDALKANHKGQVEIMIPLVATEKELKILRDLVDKTVSSVQKEAGVEFNYLVGTMIELPRAALTADKVAEHADFFSFGTNDLTQTCLGLSRDDAGRFLESYVKQDIFKADPFVSIDQDGVGALVHMACEKGRSVKENIKLGICGEHGGDPESVGFFHRVGLDYVSCSPFRVPVARLSAAQSALQD